MSDIPISELERRMCSGAWSQGGFLGPYEKLMDVLREGDATLKRLGVTYEQIANKIEELIKAACEENLASWRAQERTSWRIGRSPVILAHFAVIIKSYLGYQMCPRSKNFNQLCKVGSGSRYGSIDFVITNNRTGEQLKGPGLIVHLIRDHHFFEGKHSPYRVDPEKAVRVLELIIE